jgi:predicted RNA methylase
MCTIDDYKDMVMCQTHKNYIAQELEEWHKTYLPIPPGSVVLDLGSGCGETARFYRLHGAKHVIGIESDAKCVANARINEPTAEFICAAIDRIKCDIEGGEKDMIIEDHLSSEFKVIHTYPNGVRIFKMTSHPLDYDWLRRYIQANASHQATQGIDLPLIVKAQVLKNIKGDVSEHG